MKALVYTGPRQMEIQDLPRPVPQPGEVLLSVRQSGICGSDIHGFLGHSPRRKPGLVLGHEAVAVIADVHPTVTGWKAGQRVVVNPLMSCGTCAACLNGKQNLCANWKLIGMDRLHGTNAECVAANASQLYAVAPTLDDSAAVYAEPLANIIHFFRIAMTEVPDSIAIFGAGPIGALALAYAKVRGISRVCVIDRNPERLAAAKKLGADAVINSTQEDAPKAVQAFTHGGAEFVVDAVGYASARRDAVAACRRGGRLVFIGMAENDSPLPWIDMIRDEKSVFTTFGYTPRDFQTSLSLLESGKLNLSPWTEVRRLEEGQACFDKMTDNPGATLKLVFKFD